MLGVMCYRNLNEAIDLVNATGFGLTSGLESLDDREQMIWRSRIRAGNLYLNRPTTGAIVLRQPFGGMGKSAFGPGIKAGGPNYIVPLMEFHGKASPLTPSAKPILASLRTMWDSLHQPNLRDRLASETGLVDSQWQELLSSLCSYDVWAREEFLGEHDHFRLIGQDNVRRYFGHAAASNSAPSRRSALGSHRKSRGRCGSRLPCHGQSPQPYP